MIPRWTLLLAVAALAADSAYLALARRTAGDLATLVREGWREGTIDRRLTVSQRMLQAKTEAVAEVIAGRMTLRETAARFRELNTLMDDGNDGIGPYLVVSEEEPLWRNVLLWVRAELYQRGDQDAGAVLPRLQAEYRERFGHDPDPGASPRTIPPAWSAPYPP
jgi:hypothetical protein